MAYPARGAVLQELETGRRWTWSGEGWVRCDTEFITRLVALLSEWEGGEDGIRKAAAADLRQHVGDIKEWLG